MLLCHVTNLDILESGKGWLNEVEPSSVGTSFVKGDTYVCVSRIVDHDCSECIGWL